MSFGDAIKTCFRKYVTFSGRARRPEYWYFMLFLFLASIVLGIADSMLFGRGGLEARSISGAGGFAGGVSYGDGPLSSIFNLVILLPTLAVGWRRMHDSGRPGYLLLFPMLLSLVLPLAVILLVGFDAIFTQDPGTLMTGFGGLLSGLSGLGLMIGLFVFLLSPLLVLWWLTRPTQPHPNAWGVVPT